MATECGCAALVGLAGAGLPPATGRLQWRRVECRGQSRDQQDSAPASCTAAQGSATIGRSVERAADQGLEGTKERPEDWSVQAARGQDPPREANEKTDAEWQERVCELERSRTESTEGTGGTDWEDDSDSESTEGTDWERMSPRAHAMAAAPLQMFCRRPAHVPPLSRPVLRWVQATAEPDAPRARRWRPAQRAASSARRRTAAVGTVLPASVEVYHIGSGSESTEGTYHTARSSELYHSARNVESCNIGSELAWKVKQQADVEYKSGVLVAAVESQVAHLHAHVDTSHC